MLRQGQYASGHVIFNTWRSSLLRSNPSLARQVHKGAAARRTAPSSIPKPTVNGVLSEMSTSRRLGLYGALGVALISSFYTAQVIVALTKATTSESPTLDLSTQKDVVGRYDEIANSFDSDVNTSEWLMGILSLRKLLAQMCHGNILEVSCGTGRNLGYFDFEDAKEGAPVVKSLTFIDISEQMVQVCRRKWAVLHGVKSLQSGYWKQKPVRFVAGSALEQMPLAPDGSRYDTIMQTMGLCSTPAPEELLKNLVQHLNVKNPDARILLLEHGRSTKTWLNNVLDKTAEKHAENYGCWYNRDIDAIVKHAAEEVGLEVAEAKRLHFGTTFVYELKAGVKLIADGEVQKQGPMTVMRKESVVHRAWSQLFGK